MQQAFRDRRYAGNIDRCAGEGNAGAGLITITKAPVIGRHVPRRIVRRRRHDADFMALRGKAFAHFGVVFRDADQIGRVVDAANEDAHGLCPPLESRQRTFDVGIVG